MRQGTKYKARR